MTLGNRSLAARAIFIIVILGVGAYMLWLSACAPIMSDDLWYSLGMDRRELQDASDVVRSCVALYNRYGARLGTMGFFLVSFFGRWLFVALNPVVFLTLGYLTFILALGRRPRVDSLGDAGLLAMVYLLIGGAAPAITEVSFWANGAMQYLWGCTAVFAFLVPFRYLLDGRSALANSRETAALMGLAGVLVGQATETIVPAAIGLIVVLWLVSLKRKTPLPAWFFTGLAGLVLGFIVFALAPGNINRAANASSRTLWNMGLLERLFNVVPYHFKKFTTYSGQFLTRVIGGTVLVGLIAMTLDSLKSRRNAFATLRRERLALACVFFVAAVFMVVSLFVPPVKTSSRVFFGSGMILIVFLVIFVHALFIDKYPVLAKYVVGLTCFVCFMQMAAIAKEYVGIHEQYRRRLEIIDRARGAGVTSLEIPLFERQRRRHVWLADITKDPNHARNRSFAFYYGFDEVIGVDPGDSSDETAD